jgi:hypothetical protein
MGRPGKPDLRLAEVRYAPATALDRPKGIRPRRDARFAPDFSGLMRSPPAP